MSEKQEAIERLQALELRSGGSHEMLSSIAKAIYEPTHGGWTIGACQVLRDTLVRLLSETDTAPSGVSITDELRALFDRDTMRKDVYDELTAIADRIDAAHEEAIQREHEKAYDAGYAEGMGVANKADMRAEYLRGKNDGYDEGWDAGFASADDWLGQHEDAMAEHGWLRLPKGADGRKLNGAPRGTAVLLEAGRFCAIFPGEAHMVGGKLPEGPDGIVKWVTKVPAPAEFEVSL